MKAPRVDGTGKAEVYELIMIKLFEPAAESAALLAETTGILEAHSEGFLEATRLLRIFSRMGSSPTPPTRRARRRRDTTSDRAESFFSQTKHVMKRLPGINQATAGGAAAARLNHTFDPPSELVARKGTDGDPTPSARLDETHPHAQESAVETARRLANPVKNEDRQFRASNLAAMQQGLAD